MTPAEVGALLVRLAAVYGRRAGNRAVAAEWERALAAVPATHANATLDRLVDQGEPGPSLPVFVAHVRAMFPPPSSTVVARPPDPDDSGPPGEGPTERGRAAAAVARERLAASRAWTPDRSRCDDATGTPPDDVTLQDTN